VARRNRADIFGDGLARWLRADSAPIQGDSEADSAPLAVYNRPSLLRAAHSRHESIIKFAMPDLAERMTAIQPFYVMEVLDRAKSLERDGHPVIHLELGEPDFPSPARIVDAGVSAIKHGHTGYTQATGLPGLREAINAGYPVSIRPGYERVLVTPGSSGALQMVFAAIVDIGDEVLMADPNYPCNSNFVRLYGGRPVGVPVDASTNYHLTAELVERNWTAKTRVVLVTSPCNPTGTVIEPEQMRRLIEVTERRGGVIVSDEIYHGLVYDAECVSALAYSPDVFVVNSFSKYYGMTGWRLGWLVAPRRYTYELTKLAQNLFISPNTPAQYAALSAFDPGVKSELEQRRLRFRDRRDYFVPALRELGFRIPVLPQGAFYIYADVSAFCDDSEAFALELLQQTYIGIAPGRDFGCHAPGRHVRFAYANDLANLKEAVSRMSAYLRARTDAH